MNTPKRTVPTSCSDTCPYLGPACSPELCDNFYRENELLRQKIESLEKDKEHDAIMYFDVVKQLEESNRALKKAEEMLAVCAVIDDKGEFARISTNTPLGRSLYAVLVTARKP